MHDGRTSNEREDETCHMTDEQSLIKGSWGIQEIFSGRAVTGVFYCLLL